MKNNKKFAVFIFVGILLIILLVLIAIKSGTKKNETSKINVSPLFVSHITGNNDNVKSPEIERPVEAEVTGENIYVNYAQGYSLMVPVGYSVSEGKNEIYLTSEDKSEIFILIVEDTTCQTGTKVWENADSRIYRTNINLLDTFYSVINYGTIEIETRNIGEYEVAFETGEVWLDSGEKTPLMLSEFGYYTVFNEKAIYLYGMGTNSLEAQLTDVMDEVLQNISYTVDEIPTTTEVITYSSNKTDGISFTYDAAWTISENKDGMIILAAPNDMSTQYKGMVIEIIADENNVIVEDYAQFSGMYEYEFLKGIFVQDVGEDAFGVESHITNCNLEGKIKEKDAIIFEITDVITPRSNAVYNSLYVPNTEITQVRYTFRSNYCDCAINFVLPNESCYDYMNTFLEDLELR